MNNSHVSSKVNEIKGKVKEEVGHLTGDNSLAAEGVTDRVKGKVQEKIADAKDKIKTVVDKALDRKPEDEKYH